MSECTSRMCATQHARLTAPRWCASLRIVYVCGCQDQAALVRDHANASSPGYMPAAPTAANMISSLQTRAGHALRSEPPLCMVPPALPEITPPLACMANLLAGGCDGQDIPPCTSPCRPAAGANSQRSLDEATASIKHMLGLLVNIFLMGLLWCPLGLGCICLLQAL